MKDFKDTQFSLYRSYILDANENCPVCISKDGSKLYRGSDDNNIKVWDVETGKLLGSMSGHKNWIISLTLSPDGAFLISSAYDNTIRIWNTVDYKCYLTIKPEEAKDDRNISIKKVIASHDNKIIAAAINDYDYLEYYINLYEFKTGKKIITFREHRQEIFDITLHPESYLASGGLDKTIILYDLNNRIKNSYSAIRLNSELISPNSIYHLDFINKGALLISGEAGERQGNIRIWDFKKKEILREIKTDPITKMAISPIEKIIAIASLEKRPKYANEANFQGWYAWQFVLKIWSYQTGTILHKLPIETKFNPFEEELNHLAFSKDCNTIIAGFSSQVIKIWKKSISINNNKNNNKNEKFYEKKSFELSFMRRFEWAMKPGNNEEIAMLYEHSENFWKLLSRENFLKLLEMNLLEFIFDALKENSILYYGFDKHDETIFEYYLNKLPPSENKKLIKFRKIYKKVPIIYKEGLESYVLNQYTFEIEKKKVIIYYYKAGEKKLRFDPFQK